MSISNTDNIVRATLTGSGQTIPVSFYFLDEDHLEVTRNRSGVTSVLTVNADYTVTGAGEETGGSITMTAGQSSDVIAITYNVPSTQGTDYTEGGNAPAATRERVADKLTMQIKELKEKISRALLSSVTSTDTFASSPTASTFVYFDSSGVPQSYTSAQVLALLNLEIPTGVVDRPTALFADAAARALAAPDFSGQIGIQLDTLAAGDTLGSLYVSTSTSAGAWQESDARVTTAETDIRRAELATKGALFNHHQPYGFGDSPGSGTPELSTKDFFIGNESSTGGDDFTAFGNISYHPGLKRLTVSAYRGGGHLDNDSYGVWSYSDDGGTTWSTPTTVISNPATANTGVRDINHVVLQDGRIMLAWSEASNITGSRDAWWAKVKFSDDGGDTWGSETTLESRVNAENVIFAGEPTQMKDGTIIVPAYHHTASGNYNNKFFYSTDNGSTWNSRDIVDDSFATDCSETKIIELADGTWAAFYRQESPAKMYRRTSSDSGATWGLATDVTPTPSSGTFGACRPDLCLLSTGTILIYYRITGDGTHFAASYDNGGTWSTSTQIDHIYKFIYGGFVEIAPGFAASVAFSQDSGSGTYAAGYFHKIYDGAVADSGGLRLKGGNKVSYSEGGLPITNSEDRPSTPSNYPMLWSAEAKCAEAWNGQLWETQAPRTLDSLPEDDLQLDLPVETLALGALATWTDAASGLGNWTTAGSPVITDGQLRGRRALVLDGSTQDAADVTSATTDWDFLHNDSEDWTLYVPFYIDETDPNKFIGLFTNLASYASSNIGFVLGLENRSSSGVDHSMICGLTNGAGFAKDLRAASLSGAPSWGPADKVWRDRTWHCAAVSYLSDPANPTAPTGVLGTMKLYMDGELISTDGPSDSTAADRQGKLSTTVPHIGSFNSAFGYLTGAVSRARVYHNLHSDAHVNMISTRLIR